MVVAPSPPSPPSPEKRLAITAKLRAATISADAVAIAESLALARAAGLDHEAELAVDKLQRLTMVPRGTGSGGSGSPTAAGAGFFDGFVGDLQPATDAPPPESGEAVGVGDQVGAFPARGPRFHPSCAPAAGLFASVDTATGSAGVPEVFDDAAARERRRDGSAGHPPQAGPGQINVVAERRRQQHLAELGETARLMRQALMQRLNDAIHFTSYAQAVSWLAQTDAMSADLAQICAEARRALDIGGRRSALRMAAGRIRLLQMTHLKDRTPDPTALSAAIEAASESRKTKLYDGAWRRAESGNDAAEEAVLEDAELEKAISKNERLLLCVARHTADMRGRLQRIDIKRKEMRRAELRRRGQAGSGAGATPAPPPPPPARWD
eukprot:SAG11_NODE_5635_length_1501_cov_0.980029_1_plen_381_part_00